MHGKAGWARAGWLVSQNCADKNTMARPMAGYLSTVLMVIGPVVRTRRITPASAESPS
jgi:hypothetical protein